MIKDFYIGKVVNLDLSVKILNSDSAIAFQDSYRVTKHDILSFDNISVEFIYCDNYIIVYDSDADIAYFGECIHNDIAQESAITEHFGDASVNITHNDINYDYVQESEFIECVTDKNERHLVKLFNRSLQNNEEVLFVVVENGTVLKLYTTIVVNKKAFI